jgi:rhodanese-related sulfurtransferase
MFRSILVSMAIFSGSIFAQPLYIGAVKGLLEHAEKTVKQIDVKTLKQMIEANEKFVLIDLRGDAQVERGEIYYLSSHKIERGYLEFQIEKKVPDKNSKVVLYCCSGLRSILATESLMKMGYTDVASLKGGVIEWVNNDLPLDTTFGELVNASKHE